MILKEGYIYKDVLTGHIFKYVREKNQMYEFVYLKLQDNKYIELKKYTCNYNALCSMKFIKKRGEK